MLAFYLPPQATASRKKQIIRGRGLLFVEEEKKKSDQEEKPRIAPTAFGQIDSVRRTSQTPCTPHASIHLYNSTSLQLVRVLPGLSSDSIDANNYANRFIAMAESSESGPIARATKPVSEALLNEKV